MEKHEIPKQLPSLAPFPPPDIRKNLHPAEWQACLDAWIFCVEFRLRLPLEHFHHFRLSNASSNVSFLSSYFQSWTSPPESASQYHLECGKERKLHRDCLLLLRRLLLETDTPYDCSARELFTLLANASAGSGTSSLWNNTLQQTWQRQEKLLSTSVEEAKSQLIKAMADVAVGNHETLRLSVRQITTLSKCLHQAGKIMMTEYDYVDSLTRLYNDLPDSLQAADLEDLRKLLTENLFVCLRSLMAKPDSLASLLLDVISGLKTHAEAEAEIDPSRPTLLSSLVCLTSFLRHLEVFVATFQKCRGDSVLLFLRSYKTQMSSLHSMPQARISRSRKGKSKATADHSVHDTRIHKAAQVSQIHELFPDTPTPQVLRLLDHFSGDVEAVTAALLEPESLPAGLRHPESFANHVLYESNIHSELSHRSIPPLAPTRRNIFDDDDLDKLRISTSQVHIGRRERSYEGELDASEKAKKKAAIMAALAAFDSDDDERDDTYDVGDVGGAVDNTVDTDARPRAITAKNFEDVDVNEQTLFRAWRSHPQMFARDSKTRLSKPRQELKSETGMSDEQIEGWAIMLSRDDASVKKLESKYSGPAGFGGQQKVIANTKWSASRSGTATEDDTDTELDGGDGSPRGETSSRGGPSKRGRGRGATSGPSGDVGTHNARKRKEQGRGRGGANHNRREGRARKMGRGFGSLPPS
jgi:activating signal cointegrator complex subunit 2